MSEARPYPSVHGNPMVRSNEDYKNVVFPLLVSHGVPGSVLINLLFRIQWGCNYKTFTTRWTDPKFGDVTSEMDMVIKRVRTGSAENPWLLNAYLLKAGEGPVLSYGIAKAASLVEAFNSHEAFTKPNRYDKHLFRCVRFNSEILKDKIYGFNVE